MLPNLSSQIYDLRIARLKTGISTVKLHFSAAFVYGRGAIMEDDEAADVTTTSFQSLINMRNAPVTGTGPHPDQALNGREKRKSVKRG